MERARFNICLVSIWGMVLTLVLLCIRKQPETMHQYRKDSEIEPINEYLYCEKGCSDDEIEEILTLIGYLPPSLLDKFKQENGTIILVSDLKGGCIGSTEIEPDNITIYIQDGYVFHALIHEFGHIYLHFHPMEEEFKELFKTEAKSLITAYYGDSPYYYNNEKEYFAQAFQTVLCMGGHDTQKAAPDTFCYMSRLIGEMFDEK